jgi:hypothetical protein
LLILLHTTAIDVGFYNLLVKLKTIAAIKPPIIGPMTGIQAYAQSLVPFSLIGKRA